MRRKGFKFLVVSSILALGISSCAVAPSGGGGDPSGEVEKQKRAIYDLAVASGYQGTYEEWLDSIRGANGATILFGTADPGSTLGNNGDAYLNTSTWDIFVKYLTGWTKIGNIMGPKGDPGKPGDPGEPGKDGVSVVSITLSSTSGLVDTYEILYSNGTKSYFTVTNGADGSKGIDGQPGKDGHTPVITISSDGYWVVDGVKTDSKAQGPKGDPGDPGEPGEPGKDGVSITSITKTSSTGLVDTYTITYSDGNTSTFTVTNGEDGTPGIDGQPGKDGHTPVITISADGYWVVDGEQTTTLAQGPKGDQGEPGQTAWSNTILPSYNGYVTVDVGSALVGELVTFTAYPNPRYKLATIYLNNVDYTSQFDYETNTLTVPMVEHGYVVRAIFDYNQHDCVFYGYDGQYVTGCNVDDGEYVAVDQWVDIDGPDYIKPSDEYYDYVLAGWTVNGEIIRVVHMAYGPVTEDIVIRPYYTEVEKVDIKERYGVDHEGTYEDPFNNEDAIKVAKNLRKEDMNRTFYIQGVVDHFYNAPENRSDGEVAFYLVPSVLGGEQFEVYGLEPRKSEFAFEELYPGRELIVAGQLTIYDGKAETRYNAQFIEYVNEANPPVMENHEVTVAEAVSVASSLVPGDTTYDTYTVTGYVVGRKDGTYFLADSLEGYTQTFEISPYINIEESIISTYLGYGNLITFTDHIRNNKGVATGNRYHVDSSMFTLIEEGEGWPTVPTQIRFLDHDYYVEVINVKPGQTIRLDYVIDQGSINDVSCGVTYANASFENGQFVFELPEHFDEMAYNMRPYMLFGNSNGAIVGRLGINVIYPDVPATSLTFNYNSNVIVGTRIDVNHLSKTYSPAHAVFEGFELTSSDLKVATVNGSTITFIGEGEVDITVIETLSLIENTLHFVVGTSDLSVIVSELLEEFETLPDTELYETNAVIWLEEGTETYRSLYRSMFMYTVLTHGVTTSTYSFGENDSFISGILTINGNDYQVTYVEANTFGVSTQFSITAMVNESIGEVCFGPLQYSDVRSLPVVPNTNVGSTLYFMPYIMVTIGEQSPFTIFSPILKPYISFESSNEEVAVVENLNVIKVVGAGECVITINLADGSTMTYQLVASQSKALPADAVLLDISNYDFFTTYTSSVSTSIFYSPKENMLYMYNPRVDQVINAIPIEERGGNLFVQMGNEDYEGIYFNLNNKQMVDPNFVALESLPAATYTDRIGRNLTFTLGEDGIVYLNIDKLVLNENTIFEDVDIYCGYIEEEEGQYFVSGPFGRYRLTVVDDELVATEIVPQPIPPSPVDPTPVPSEYVEFIHNAINALAVQAEAAGLTIDNFDTFSYEDFVHQELFYGSYSIEEKEQLMTILTNVVINAFPELTLRISDWMEEGNPEQYGYVQILFREFYYTDDYSFEIDVLEEEIDGEIVLTFNVIAMYQKTI